MSAPAEATWKAGVDVLSFGATKGGALAAEAVVFFDPKLAAMMPERRKRAGHLFSKHRFLAAQFEAYLNDDYGLTLARHANAMADLLAARLEGRRHPRLVAGRGQSRVRGHAEGDSTPNCAPPAPPIMSGAATACPRTKCWCALVTSFATREDEVEQFAALTRG